MPIFSRWRCCWIRQLKEEEKLNTVRVGKLEKFLQLLSGEILYWAMLHNCPHRNWTQSYKQYQSATSPSCLIEQERKFWCYFSSAALCNNNICRRLLLLPLLLTAGFAWCFCHLVELEWLLPLGLSLQHSNYCSWPMWCLAWEDQLQNS